MAVVILVASYAVTAAIYLTVTRLAVGERARAFKAISPGMLPPLAIVFALLVGFLAAQVWSDADRAATAVNREASALRAAVLLSDQFPGETQTRLHGLIRQHIRTAVAEEWPAMARRGASLTLVPRALADGRRGGRTPHRLTQPAVHGRHRGPPHAAPAGDPGGRRAGVAPRRPSRGTRARRPRPPRAAWSRGPGRAARAAAPRRR